MKYISAGILIVMFGGAIGFMFQACSAPFIEVQVTQRVNTQDDPVIMNSEMQGSERLKTHTSSPEIDGSIKD